MKGAWVAFVAAALLAGPVPAEGQRRAPAGDVAPGPAAEAKPPAEQPGGALGGLPDLAKSRQGVSTALQWVTMVTVLSVAPALAVMVTCFTRIIVVLGLLRQALASHQVPPNHVLFGLALLMTLVVMSPVFAEVYREAVQPYLDGRLTQQQALDAGAAHLRRFMIRQIEAADNADEVYLFLDERTAGRKDLQWRDVPTFSLIPAFVVSELKVAFFMGFRIYLPFLVVDLLVASVLVSMGVLMLPPVLVSLPFKLLLFVMADGWHLVIGTLMRSFG